MREDAQQLLEAYVTAASEADADRHLGRILDVIAKPIVRRIVASVFRAPANLADADDLVSDTLTELLRRLRELRADPSHPIHDLRGYVVTATYNRCHERLRERSPARSRLRNQLQYLCGHDSRLARWRTADGVLLCGLREWSGREAAGETAAENLAFPARSDPAAEDRAQIAALTFAVFRALGAPLALDTLTGTIGRLIGLEHRRVEVPLANVTAGGAAADEQLEVRMSLRELWQDVGQLAPNQRAALLLNLRDVQGRECLSLLPLTRTATVEEVGKMVGIPFERFAVLWNDLPLSDAAIAELLGATPRQVIKWRRLARERLRRIAANRQRSVREETPLTRKAR